MAKKEKGVLSIGDCACIYESDRVVIAAALEDSKEAIDKLMKRTERLLEKIEEMPEELVPEMDTGVIMTTLNKIMSRIEATETAFKQVKACVVSPAKKE